MALVLSFLGTGIGIYVGVLVGVLVDMLLEGGGGVDSLTLVVVMAAAGL
jgi:hypothetical protein